MKNELFLFLALSTGITTLTAQNLKADYSVSARQFNVVMLQLSGNSVVQGSGTDEVRVKSAVFSKGKVWGWRFPADRPSLKISHHYVGDTLYISTPDHFRPGIIGISTYTESLENTVSVPSGKKLIIHGSGYLSIEDNFSQLEQSGSGTVSLSIRQSEVSRLKCKAVKRLLVDGAAKTSEYELNGRGSEQYQLYADVIKVNFK